MIAPYYDFLANLVFGNTLIRAQQKFLESIEPNSSILILGGGSGQILTDIDNIVKGCTINFIEISTGMMELARNRKVINNTIVFDQHLEPSTRTYDIIIMNFFLDQFTES
ncbi:MAG: hypothetical protein HC811_00060 [Flammeovirgaceae bacterium]|nr:hypothetical protein [Flammeovirgaceae bacterium]